MRKVAFGLVAGLVLLANIDLTAQEKADDPEQLPVPRAEPQEQLPVPRQIEPGIILMIPRPEIPRPGRKSVWEFYGVDSTGNVQPKVVYSPSGAYYRYNGAPYPWSSTWPGSFSRFVSD